MTTHDEFAPDTFAPKRRKAAAGPLTIECLVTAYQTDKLSTYHKLRYHVRMNHDGMLRRIVEKHGRKQLVQIKYRTLREWHQEWSHDGEKIAVAHSAMAQLRTLFSFGMTMLEDSQCERLSLIMSKTRFPVPPPRTERMTAEQAIAIRKAAHARGWHSIALAQAFQFELMLRQKDVIGEWVPFDEPGVSDVAYHVMKWLHGIRWSEIDDNLILRHVTSKKSKPVQHNLKLAEMVMEELALLGERPKSGPILICEHTNRPWLTGEFRRKWRIVANDAGVPKAVKNMDSRAGAITEATEAGADLEHVKHAAAHSNIAMTQRYSRGGAEKTEGVMQRRVEHRAKARANG